MHSVQNAVNDLDYLFSNTNLNMKKTKSHLFPLTDKMVVVFTNSPNAAFRHQRNFKDIIVRTRLKNPLSNGGFNNFSDTRYLMRKRSSDADSVSSLDWPDIPNIWLIIVAMITVCNFSISNVNFVRNNT